MHIGKPYGYDFQMEKVNDLFDVIEKDLSTLYLDEDLHSYFDQAFDHQNDQWGPAILTKLILGEVDSLKIFSKKWSDYTDVFEDGSPAKVASVFYGVIPK